MTIKTQRWYYCDRCGIEISEPRQSFYSFASPIHDFCNDCEIAHKKFMENGKRQMPKRARDGKFLPRTRKV